MKQYDPNLQPDDIKNMLISGTDLWKSNYSLQFYRNTYGHRYINGENSISLKS